MQKIRNTGRQPPQAKASSPSGGALARPPTIEDLVNEGFAQNPGARSPPRARTTPSLGQLLLDLPPQAPSSSSGVAYLPCVPPASPSFQGSVVGPLSSIRLPSIARPSLPAAEPELFRTTTAPAGATRARDREAQKRVGLASSSTGPSLFRTTTAPAGGCREQTAAVTLERSLSRLAPSPVVVNKPAEPAPARTLAAPVLRLPIPLRHEASPCSMPSSPTEAAGAKPVSTMLYNHSRQLHAAKAKPVPPRLREIDDQTRIPKEVHAKMMLLGDQARGTLGYGQHRTQFDPNGSGERVLCRWDLLRK